MDWSVGYRRNTLQLSISNPLGASSVYSLIALSHHQTASPVGVSKFKALNYD